MENFKITKEMLKSGNILVSLIEKYNKEDNENSKNNFRGVLRCLRDSTVIVPLNVKLSDEDIEKIKNSNGRYFVSISNDINIAADIIESNDGDKYFPVFSQKAQIPIKYGKNFNLLPIEFTTVIELAKTHDVKGIVVDPFTENFIVPSDIYDAVKELPSEIEE